MTRRFEETNQRNSKEDSNIGTKLRNTEPNKGIAVGSTKDTVKNYIVDATDRTRSALSSRNDSRTGSRNISPEARDFTKYKRKSAAGSNNQTDDSNIGHVTSKMSKEFTSKASSDYTTRSPILGRYTSRVADSTILSKYFSQGVVKIAES